MIREQQWTGEFRFGSFKRWFETQVLLNVRNNNAVTGVLWNNVCDPYAKTGSRKVIYNIAKGQLFEDSKIMRIVFYQIENFNYSEFGEPFEFQFEIGEYGKLIIKDEIKNRADLWGEAD